MPAKRRVGKARKQLDQLEIEDLWYGPGTCLLGGCGYLAPYNDGLWHEKSPEVQAAVLDTMRADWNRHWPAVMDAWHNRSPHDLWIAKEHHGAPAEPWALTEFGPPDTRGERESP